MSGERWFARPLDGKLLRQWYFPSKYGFQNFKMEEYIEMQAERFKDRPVHPSVKLFSDTLTRVAQESVKIGEFLEKNKGDKSLDDLKAIYDMVVEEDKEVRDEDEIAFLLETLRAHAGAEKAIQIASKLNNELISLVEARRLILDCLKQENGKGMVGSGGFGVDYSESEKKILGRRHRFVDPLQRRRRLKWMERLLQGKHSAQELKHGSHYKTHPDQQEIYPTNMGPVTIKWPSPYQ